MGPGPPRITCPKPSNGKLGILQQHAGHRGDQDASGRPRAAPRQRRPAVGTDNQGGGPTFVAVWAGDVQLLSLDMGGPDLGQEADAGNGWPPSRSGADQGVVLASKGGGAVGIVQQDGRAGVFGMQATKPWPVGPVGWGKGPQPRRGSTWRRWDAAIRQPGAAQAGRPSSSSTCGSLNAPEGQGGDAAYRSCPHDRDIRRARWFHAGSFRM